MARERQGLFWGYRPGYPGELNPAEMRHRVGGDIRLVENIKRGAKWPVRLKSAIYGTSRSYASKFQTAACGYSLPATAPVRHHYWLASEE
jgi:hypothetical protein